MKLLTKAGYTKEANVVKAIFDSAIQREYIDGNA
jgi:hypothetical protein